MSDSDSAPKMSIAERIAALQNKGNDNLPPPLTKPKTNKNALAGRIASLQKNVDSTACASEVGSKPDAPPKVGKLKLPAGAVPIMQFGAGPPPSLLKKQRERVERMEKLQQEAKLTDDVSEEKPKVGKLNPPAGAVPIMPFGSGLPPSLLKKQKEREEKMNKLQQEAIAQTVDEDVDDALLSRPTIKGGKRRPRTRA
mmetsp:Transcript_5613/g.10889  ORF Transcript_5613/g.10889 Transcript_5613/m.10889 type:complete len:197 (-) Transcript_5613:659-1249(-)|eukprot:CAMPEP_0201618110 /NCGR_PEP_ID=MMETSP0492-20130828/38079_1 /ASSEMBLY_ACC=CAM_ASM_000837 /TAXON_ID=420259 /ORGANISM="Thalassiosira gravida, Strain GMp14c1" /LENGTH=196 /DNA_ID=CAMNT_0048086575 /DNA_START=11 /DNA_END=601 /DNA_ORIENTATION=+